MATEELAKDLIRILSELLYQKYWDVDEPPAEAIDNLDFIVQQARKDAKMS